MLDERFWSKVQKSDGGCWEWTAHRNRKGYGRFSVNAAIGPRFAHRLAFADAFGRIPAGKFILHGCDNPACVNPAHLRIGTAKENVADMDERQRRVTPAVNGEANPFSKLTDEKVTAIRAAYIDGMPRTELSASFDVNPLTLQDIIYGRSWTHLFGVNGSPTLADLRAARRARPGAKITEETVKEIRRRLATGEQGKDIAEAYGIHKATVSDIKCGKIWRHV